MTSRAMPPIEYSADGKMALVPRASPFNDREIWWDLKIKSPVHGGWVTVQGSTDAHWMTELGFAPRGAHDGRRFT